MIDILQGTQFTCERCGRTIGREMLECPERREDRCPYRKQTLRPMGRLLPIIFLLAGIAFVWLSDFESIIPNIIAIGVIGVGFYGTFSTITHLYNPIKKTKWKGTALLGITLNQTLTFAGEPLLFNFPDQPPPVIPHSVIRFVCHDEHLERMRGAVAIIRAAIISLVAQKVIQIYLYQQYVGQEGGQFWRAEDVYIFSISEESNRDVTDSKLERSILSVLRDWGTEEGIDLPEWPDGPPVYELVRAIYTSDEMDPALWVIDFVGRDAAIRGLAEGKGWLSMHYEPYPVDAERIRPELDRVDELSCWFGQQWPEASKVLDEQIEKAILSRQNRTFDRSYDYW